MTFKSKKEKHSYEEQIIKNNKKPLTEEEIIKNNQYTYLDDLILNSCYKPTLLTLNNHFICYETKTDKNTPIEEILQIVRPHIEDLINKHKDIMHKLKLHMNIFYLTPDRDNIMYSYEVKTNKEKINQSDDTNNVIKNLFNFFMNDYNEKTKYGFGFKFIDSIQYYIHKE